MPLPQPRPAPGTSVLGKLTKVLGLRRIPAPTGDPKPTITEPLAQKGLLPPRGWGSTPASLPSVSLPTSDCGEKGEPRGPRGAVSLGGPEVPKGLPRVGEGRAGKERGAESAESPSEAGLRIKGTAGSGRFVKWQYLHKGEKQVGCPSSRDCRPRGKQKRGGQEPESEGRWGCRDRARSLPGQVGSVHRAGWAARGRAGGRTAKESAV